MASGSTVEGHRLAPSRPRPYNGANGEVPAGPITLTPGQHESSGRSSSKNRVDDTRVARGIGSRHLRRLPPLRTAIGSVELRTAIGVVAPYDARAAGITELHIRDLDPAAVLVIAEGGCDDLWRLRHTVHRRVDGHQPHRALVHYEERGERVSILVHGDVAVSDALVGPRRVCGLGPAAGRPPSSANETVNAGFLIAIPLDCGMSFRRCRNSEMSDVRPGGRQDRRHLGGKRGRGRDETSAHKQHHERADDSSFTHCLWCEDSRSASVPGQWPNAQRCSAGWDGR